MASIAKRPDGRWRARYRDAAGKEHSRHFPRKVDGQRWLAEVTTAVVTGTYVDPAASRTTVAEYAATWMAAQHVRHNTAVNREVVLRLHVLPHLGSRPMASVRPTDMQGLVKRLSETLAPATVAGVLKVLRQVFAAAVDDRVIAHSPAAKVRPPKGATPPITVPTVDEVTTMAEAVPAQYRALVVLLAGSGLRIGEALGLDVRHVDFLRRTVSVERQRHRDGTLGPTKTEASVRVVPIGQVVVDELARHLQGRDADPDEPLFLTEFGKPASYRSFHGAWRRACRRTGLTTKVHDVRHFTASALIGGGATVKQVQAVLGHSTASQTLDVYAGMWPGDDDRTRAVMDAVLAPAADHLRTEGVVGE